MNDAGWRYLFRWLPTLAGLSVFVAWALVLRYKLRRFRAIEARERAAKAGAARANASVADSSHA